MGSRSRCFRSFPLLPCNVFKTKKVFIIGLHAMDVYIVVMSDMKSSVHYTSPSLETDSVRKYVSYNGH